MFRTSKRNTLRNLAAALAVIVTLAIGFFAGRTAAVEPQPQMRLALTSLREAKSHLGKAAPDKGGHRNAALEHVNKAIDEVERGIAYDNRR